MGLILDGTTGISASGNIYGANIIVTNNFSPEALSVVGNVQGNVIIGNGAGLTNVVAVSASGTAATVTTAAQPNITSTGTLVSLSVSGNANIANIGTTIITATGNVTGANLLTGGIVSATGNGTFGNVVGGNLVSANYIAGTLTTAAQPNITSTGTLASLAVTGNVTAGNVRINGGLQSNRTNVSVTTNTVIDQFAPADIRTAKYIISASSANGYQSVEALLVQDGTNSYITIYGSVCSNVTADIIEVSSNINGVSGNVSLYATSSGGTATVNLLTTYLQT
jgi:hypothetical protein